MMPITITTTLLACLCIILAFMELTVADEAEAADGPNPLVDALCAAAPLRRDCKETEGCRWEYKTKSCVRDTRDMQPEAKVTQQGNCNYDNTAICDTQDYCQWDYHSDKLNPKLVEDDATCQVRNRDTKQLGALPTVSECSAAVQVSPQQPTAATTCHIIFLQWSDSSHCRQSLQLLCDLHHLHHLYHLHHLQRAAQGRMMWEIPCRRTQHAAYERFLRRPPKHRHGKPNCGLPTVVLSAPHAPFFLLNLAMFVGVERPQQP
jgi:hypothetical protein